MMFLTTSATSISALSQVLTPNNKPTNTTAAAKKSSLSPNNPRRSTSSSRDSKSVQPSSSIQKSKSSEKSKQQQTQTSRSTNNKRRNSGDKKARERIPIPRTDTSTSTATSASTSSNTSSEATESASHSTRASSLTSSPSPAEDCPPVIGHPAGDAQYFSTPSRSSVDANNNLAATADRNSSVNSLHLSENPTSSINTSSSTKQAHTAASPSKSLNNSMRRRAGESLSGSLRAVFRDINGSNAAVPGPTANTEDNTQSLEQRSANTQRHSGSSQISHPRNSGSMTRDPVRAEPVNPSREAAKPTIANAAEMPSIKFIPHQDQRSAKPSLGFAPMTRTLPEDSSIIRVGRYSERDASPNANNSPSAAPIGFKSKVVSRRHCEFWCVNGQWFVKDVKSSSGTFLNHIRLSQPSTESKPFPINDGDIIQLGMDFRGGEESIFRCVKIRIEVNRGWQKKLNDFNTTTHKALRALSKEAGPTSSTECSICLMSVAPCQALFVAPCSHVWHYKCIRPVINNPKMYPQFLCPNCRAVADLDADIEENVDGWDETEELPDQEDETGGSIPNRVGTPVNGNPTGNDMVVDNQAEDPSIVVQPPSSEAGLASPNVSNSQIDTTELQDNTILFSETVPLELRDPRVAPDTLEGVVTPRNEAGPFVFDGSGRRVQPPQLA